MKKLCLLLILVMMSINVYATATPFEGKDSINVVYLGGSITSGTGASSPTKSWVSLVGTYLKTSLAPINVNNFNVGIGGTGSNLGFYRLQRDVISKNPDLVFIEFAVNDKDDARVEVIKYMEAIVRNLQKMQTPPKIVFVYTTTKDFNACASTHEEVAQYYGIPSINLQEYVQNSGVNTNTILADGTHPNDAGYQMYADYIIGKLQTGNYYKQPLVKEQRLIEPSYDYTARFDAANNAQKTGNWTQTATGISSSEAGATLTYKFSGPMIALLDRMSNYGGKCRIEIDGIVQKDLSMYYNVAEQAVMGYNNTALRNGDHTLKITILQEKDANSIGNKVWLDYFIIADGETDALQKLVIKSETLTDGAGNVISSLQKECLNIINMRLRNITESDIEAVGILAAYDNNNKLFNYSIINRTLYKNLDDSFGLGLAVPNEDGVFFKFFIWENNNKIMPIFKAIKFN